MEERAGKGPGKGKGKGANDGFHPSKGKGKGQPKAGKGKGHGKEPAQASAVRLDPVLETAYQVYLSGRRPDQPRISRAAWLRNNVRSDSTIRAEVRNRMQAVRNAPIAGAKPAAVAAPKGESGSPTPRQPPPPPKPRPRGPPGEWDPQASAASSARPPFKARPAVLLSSSSSSSSSDQQGAEQQAALPEASPWARRTARKTTSAKHAEHAQHVSLAPIEAAYWEEEDMEPGALSSASMASSDAAQPAPTSEEVVATPKDELCMDAVASALQQVSEAAPDPAGLPANPASPSESDKQAADGSAAADEPASQEPPVAEVVVPTPPASTAAANPAGSGAEPPSSGSETLEVECREGLRTKWLTFAYRPEECAAATLGRCRDQAAMSSLDTLSVWPDKGELDLALSLATSLRPEERRLLATGPAQVPESSDVSRKRKPVTSEDGLFCFACKQRAPSMEHMSGHFMTSAHVQAVKAYMAQ